MMAQEIKAGWIKQNVLLFLLSLVGGISAGWLEVHLSLFDKTRIQALHSMYSDFPFSPLFIASVLLGLVLAPLVVNFISRNGFSLWSLLPFFIWFGFGENWVQRRINAAFIEYEIEGLIQWVVLCLLFYAPITFVLYRLRRRQRRRLANLPPAAAAGSVWPPPPQRP